MSQALESFLESRIEALSEVGHDPEVLHENSDRLQERLRTTSSKVALVTAMGAGTGGFIEVGKRDTYHLSVDLTEQALVSGNFRTIEKVADHETVHLISAQKIDFQTHHFDEADAAFLVQEYGIKLSYKEALLPALNRYLIEGLTEAKSQQRKWADPDCAYTDEEVPATVKIVFDIQKTLGRNLFSQFNNCQEESMGETLKLFVDRLRLDKELANNKPTSPVRQAA